MTGRVAVTKMGLNDMFVVIWAITSGNTNLALAVLWLSLGVFGSIRFTLKHWAFNSSDTNIADIVNMHVLVPPKDPLTPGQRNFTLTDPQPRNLIPELLKYLPLCCI